jgi:hypothetical protein
MKRHAFYGLLGIEALLFAASCILPGMFGGLLTAAVAFPFAQIGSGLRALSLSGEPGNVAAVTIYAVTSLLPAAILLVIRKKRRLYGEDALLGVLSAVLLVVLYLMINPGDIASMAGTAAALPIAKAVLGGVVYSVLFGYFVLRALRLFSAGGTDKLLRYLSVMLRLLDMVFIYIIFSACLGGMLDSFTNLGSGNAGNEHLLGVSYVFLVLQFIVDALPYALSIFIVSAALRLLAHMREDRYSAETVAGAESLARICSVTLAATALSNITFNLLQLAFAKSLRVLNTSAQIPVFSMFFVLAVLLLTRLLAENKNLKDDNDMFI